MAWARTTGAVVTVSSPPRLRAVTGFAGLSAFAGLAAGFSVQQHVQALDRDDPADVGEDDVLVAESELLAELVPGSLVEVGEWLEVEAERDHA